MIFVDTSFWVAVYNRRDGHNDEARTLIRQQDTNLLVTTNHVRGETWTFLRRRAGHRAAVAYLDILEDSPRLRLVQVSQEVEQRAFSWLRRHDEREYSFVDATSFETMRVLRLHEALAFDGEFTAAGYVELRAR